MEDDLKVSDPASMKVLFVMDSLGSGGAEKSSLLFWNYLKAKGINFSVLLLRPAKTDFCEEVKEIADNITTVNARTFLGQVLFIRKIIRREKSNLVHSVLFQSNIRIRFAKLFYPHFTHVESLVNTTYDRSRLSDPAIKKWRLKLYQVLDEWTMRFFTDQWHAITRAVSTHYQQHLNIPANRIKVIHRGRPANRFLLDQKNKTRYRELFGLKEGDIMIVTSGRQEFQKGHVYLIDALSILSHKHGFHTFKCIFLGRNGRMTQTLQSKTEEQGLQHKIICTGHRADVEAILAAADIFAFPSLYEGLGGALIEAEAAGLPIVCSDLPVLHEVVRPGENALLFSPGDSEGMADAIYRLATDAGLRDAFGSVSHQVFLEKFQLEAAHRELLAFFEKCIK